MGIHASLAALLVLAGGDWGYVVPGEGTAMRRPTLTALPLSEDLPGDAECEIELRGEKPLYGQLRYGDPDSVRVLFALDSVSRDETALYVDANRDRRLEPGELVEGANGLWELDLAIWTRREGDVELLPRRLLFRRGRTGRLFSVATLGYVEGEVELDGETVRARRVDGDANGFYTDAGDQLWLDLDRDGSFDPLKELHLYAPTLFIGEARYAPLSGRLGEDLELRRIEGTGEIEIALDLAEGSRPTAMSILLVGEDGSSVNVRSAGEPIEAPVGRYRVGMVSLWATDPDGGQDWGFVFSGARVDRARWHAVEKGSRVAVDPIGELELLVDPDYPKAPARAGGTYGCSPRLLTADGLAINIAYRGSAGAQHRREGEGAAVRLLTPEGRVLDTGRSGFS